MLTHVEPLFRPPAEANSLILQVTQGCAHNGCRFCGMYKSKRFSAADAERRIDEAARLPEAFRREVVKVFLADGDAPAMGFAPLHAVCRRVVGLFPRLRRIAAYASPADVLTYSVEQLAELKAAKLSLFYIGLESGHEPLLAFVNKGNTAAEFVAAARRPKGAGIRQSVTAILGLGGRRFTEGHARDTAAAVTAAAPEFFSLLTLIPGGNAAYIRELDLMTRRELVAEARAIIAGLGCDTIFRTDHASNFADLGGTLQKDKAAILDRADALLADPALFGWLGQIPQFAGEMGY